MTAYRKRMDRRRAGIAAGARTPRVPEPNSRHLAFCSRWLLGWRRRTASGRTWTPPSSATSLPHAPCSNPTRTLTRPGPATAPHSGWWRAGPFLCRRGGGGAPGAAAGFRPPRGRIALVITKSLSAVAECTSVPGAVNPPRCAGAGGGGPLPPNTARFSALAGRQTRRPRSTFPGGQHPRPLSERTHSADTQRTPAASRKDRTTWPTSSSPPSTSTSPLTAGRLRQARPRQALRRRELHPRRERTTKRRADQSRPGKGFRTAQHRRPRPSRGPSSTSTTCHRSFSVGDVVVIGETAWACAPLRLGSAHRRPAPRRHLPPLKGSPP